MPPVPTAISWPSPAVGETSRRLLVLDDDPVMQELICALGESEGFEARACGNSHDFLWQIASWRPTHLTLDLEMPGQDGIQIIHQLAEQECHAALTIISGINPRLLDTVRRIAQQHHLNVTGELSKPFDHHALRAMLASANPRLDPAQPVAASATGTSAGPAPKITREMLASALQRDEFIAHFQPKVRLSSGRIAGVEALVRWRHPEHGFIAPDNFIGEMERTGQISLLTDRVVHLALQDFARAGFDDDVTLSINISAVDVGDGTLPNRVASRCAEHGVAPERLVLELTETSAMRDPDAALADLTRLRIQGFGLALDDFGVGYSSLTQLVRLPISLIKIDKSFVMSMLRSNESRKIVSSIISLGRSLGLAITGEGVESLEIARMLRGMGCDVVQGYGISRPMPADALLDWRRAWDVNTFLGDMKRGRANPVAPKP